MNQTTKSMQDSAKTRLTAAAGSPYSHLIWDFNGTVLDDVDICIECINRMLSKRGLPVFSDREQYRSSFRFPVIDYYRAVGLDLEREDYYTVLAPEWVAYYRAFETQCGTVTGARDVLHRMKAAGMRQVLLSATREDQLREQVDRLGVSGCFDEIVGNNNIHAAGKIHLVSTWMQSHPGARPLFIGDTVHDAEAADSAGADCVLYTGGHQSIQWLARTGKPLIQSLKELDKLVFPSEP